MPEPYIPETITVHLGRPDSNAPNVTLPFVDYIKNVASSEIYPTWPENALRANIYAIDTAGRLGIREDRSSNYVADPIGTRLAYEAMDCAMSSVRSRKSMGSSWKCQVERDYFSRNK